MSLYKYTKANKNTIDNLMRNEIYFKSPEDFNDPYEFILKICVDDKLYDEFLELEYGDQYTERIEKNMTKAERLREISNWLFLGLRKSLGVTCFTEHENNDIMWAHYGDCHKGICIEYDNTEQPFIKSEKVKYVDNVMNIQIDDLSYFNNNIPQIFSDALIRKNKIWDYEKEWRLIYAANSAFTYSSKSIKSITFGFFCSKSNKLKIIKATSHLNIKYFNVARSKDNYKIIKQPFDMTTLKGNNKSLL